ncbi:MAG: hypothetical protein AB7K24_04070 [Gemmataceae bacterium]
MAIEFTCSSCGSTLRAGDELAGKFVRCSGCQQTTLVEVAPTAFTEKPLPAPVLAPTEEWQSYQQEEGFEFSRPNRKPVLVLLAGAATLTLLAVVGLAYVLWPASAKIADLESFAPDNTQVVMLVNGPAMLESEVYKELKRQLPKAMEKLEGIEEKQKVAPENVIDRVALFATSPQEMVNSVQVTMTTVDMRAEDVLKGLNAAGAKSETIRGRVCYKYKREMEGFGPSERFVCLYSARTVLDGPPATIRTILERNKPGKLSDNLHAALARVDMSNAMVMAFDVKAMSKIGLPAEGPGAAYLQKVHDFVLELDMKKGMAFRGSVKCDDNNTAEELRSLAAGGMAMAKLAIPPEAPKVVAELVDKLKFEAKGPIVSGNLEMTTANVLDIIRAVEKQLDQFGLPFNQRPPLRRR